MSYVYGIYRKPRNKYYRTLFIVGVSVIVFAYLTCNYGVYYASAMQCNWPAVSPGANGVVVRIMLMADLHLLATRNVNCFKKVRSEWKIRRAFQAAANWHEPEAVFVLGDIFEKGVYYSEGEFKDNVKNFHYMFDVPEGTALYVVPGNQDMGYHGGLINEKAKRFEEQLKSPPVGLVTIRGVHFVLINSMAMEGDGCKLGASATDEIQQISDALRCAAGNQFCKIYPRPNINYSSPILIQHFPLYRESADGCMDGDLASKSKQEEVFKERRDCLYKESSLYLIEKLRPRAVFGAHLHRPCRVTHQFEADINPKDDMLEVTLPTFSWRSSDFPSYYLLAAQPKGPILVTKCYLHDSYITEIFSVLALAWFCYFMFRNRGRWVVTTRFQSFSIWVFVWSRKIINRIIVLPKPNNFPNRRAYRRRRLHRHQHF